MRGKVGRRIRMILSILLGVYVLACVGCAAFQRRMLYYPTIDSSAAFDRLGTSRGLERWKNSRGENIGWQRKASTRPPRGQVLITHGNGGCAIHRADFAEPLRESETMDIFILEYPGFGDRAGKPSESTLFSAAEDAFQSLPKTVPVYLIGESLGTGVAGKLAGSHPEIAGGLLIAPYNRMDDVAQYHVRILPARWLLRDHFRSDEHLRNYHGPVAIWVGGKDEIIPAKFGRRLFDGYGGPKRLWEAPQAGHNSIHAQSAAYWKEVIAFWRANQS